MLLIWFFGLLSLNGFKLVQLTCSPSSHYCGESQFYKCIPKEWVCDRNKDCDNGSDEVDCKAVICKTEEFHCINSDDCIHNSAVCDGKKDCLDNSDEFNCAIVPAQKTCDMKTEYDCKNSATVECIPLASVCEKLINCSNGNDNKENCEIDMCRLNNSGKKCSDICINKYSSFACDCPRGMRLGKDNRTCQRIDVCHETPQICDQECSLTTEGHICSCYEGFARVGTQCVLTSPKAAPHLLYMTYNEIYEVSLGNNATSVPKMRISSADKLLTFDSKLNEENLEIYSSHVDTEPVLTSSTIYKWNTFNIMDTAPEERKTTSTNLVWLNSFYSLAADPVRNLVFWTDTKNSKISVFNSSSLDKIDIIVTDCYNPINLVLDPIATKLFWIDLGNGVIGPRIMMSNMDGSSQSVLIKDGLRKSTSLAIDVENQRLYWNDLFPGSIKFVDLKSITKGDFKIHVLFESRDYFPYSIALYKNWIYWSDLHQNRIYSVHKISGKGLRTIMEQVRFLTIRIVSPLLDMNIKSLGNGQKSATSCSGVHNPCLYSCLPTASNTEPKCFGSFHPTKGNASWWFLMIPIALLFVGLIITLNYRRLKSGKERNVFVTTMNTPVYNHVKFWDEDNDESINDSHRVDVSDVTPIIQTV